MKGCAETLALSGSSPTLLAQAQDLEWQYSSLKSVCQRSDFHGRLTQHGQTLTRIEGLVEQCQKGVDDSGVIDSVRKVGSDIDDGSLLEAANVAIKNSKAKFSDEMQVQAIHNTMASVENISTTSGSGLVNFQRRVWCKFAACRIIVLSMKHFKTGY